MTWRGAESSTQTSCFGARDRSENLPDPLMPVDDSLCLVLRSGQPRSRTSNAAPNVE
jgi:hypothetical protein